MEAPVVARDPDAPLPQTRQDSSAAVHWCALIFAMCFPGVMAWVYFVVLVQPIQEAGAPISGALPVYLASKLVQFGFPIFWLWAMERRRLRPAIPSFKGLALGLSFGVCVAAVILSAYHGVLKGSPILSDMPGRIRDKLILF